MAEGTPSGGPSEGSKQDRAKWSVGQKIGMGCLVLVGLFIGLLVLGAIVGPPEDSGSKVAVTEEAEPGAGNEAIAVDAPEKPANAPEMSAAEFAALRTGMGYDEAVAIIGSPGELISESEMAGIRTQMYQWEGEGSFGANANAMFQNGKLVQKAQFGLE